MASAEDPPSAPGPAPVPPRPRGRRPLLLLLVTAAAVLLGSLWTITAVMAAVGSAGLVGLLLGLLPAVALPAFLAARAVLALRRRGAGARTRLVVVLFLFAIVHLATVGVVTTWIGRTSGDLAKVAHDALAPFGGVPVLSGVLAQHATATGSMPKEPTTSPGTDGGPGSAVDGGVASTAAASTDGGPAAQAAPPYAPRSATGRVVEAFAAAATLQDGDKAIVVLELVQGGGVTRRLVELAPVADRGGPTVVDTADDGAVAAVLGGGHVVVARPGKPASLVPALSRGAKLGGKGDEIRAVRDVAIAPGGALLAVVEVTASAASGEVVVADALASLRPGESAASVVKRAGDAVPDAAERSVSRSYALKRPPGDGGVLVLETFLEGGADVGTSLSGPTYTMNPVRLLSGRIDAPRALVEVARTGDALNGLEGKSLQSILDAAALPDGRVLFDGGFLEEGGAGWLFLARGGGSGVFAVAPELYGKDQAPWTARAPRAMRLTVEPDGAFAFATRDGGVVLASIDRPAEGRTVLRGAEAFRADGTKAGVVTGVGAPLLSRGGAWLVAGVDLQPEQGARRRALVLASSADLAAGKVEVLLEEERPLPGTARGVRALSFDEGRADPLWLTTGR